MDGQLTVATTRFAKYEHHAVRTTTLTLTIHIHTASNCALNSSVDGCQCTNQQACITQGQRLKHSTKWQRSCTSPSHKLTDNAKNVKRENPKLCKKKFNKYQRSVMRDVHGTDEILVSDRHLLCWRESKVV